MKKALKKGGFQIEGVYWGLDSISERDNCLVGFTSEGPLRGYEVYAFAPEELSDCAENIEKIKLTCEKILPST